MNKLFSELSYYVNCNALGKVLILFFDFFKAFDVLSHAVLLWILVLGASVSVGAWFHRNSIKKDEKFGKILIIAAGMQSATIRHLNQRYRVRFPGKSLDLTKPHKLTN